MGFSDIFKQSFLEGFSGMELGFREIMTVFFITSCLAVYIFFVYRIVTRKTFYSKSFNISLAVLCLITSGIILTIQFSVIVSLGMVGALSIVRFRTAVKDPMDLVFLFWSISVGIICGAGLAEVAVVLSITVTLGIIFLDRMPVVNPPMILIIHTDHVEMEGRVLDAVKKYCRYSKVKSRNIKGGGVWSLI